MTPHEFLRNCGWHKGVGPNYYLPQNHPHLHLGLDGVGLETGNIGNCANYQN